MTIVTAGIDLAKNIFAVHGVDADGKPFVAQVQVRQRRAAQGVEGFAAMAAQVALQAAGVPIVENLRAAAIRHTGLSCWRRWRI